MAIQTTTNVSATIKLTKGDESVTRTLSNLESTTTEADLAALARLYMYLSTADSVTPTLVRRTVIYDDYE